MRASLVDAAARHLPDWPDRVTPHVLRHFCASELYRHGMDLIAIQETLGHAWIATTMGYGDRDDEFRDGGHFDQLDGGPENSLKLGDAGCAATL